MKSKILFHFIFFIEIELLDISVGLLSTVAGMAMVLARVVAVGSSVDISIIVLHPYL